MKIIKENKNPKDLHGLAIDALTAVRTLINALENKKVKTWVLEKVYRTIAKVLLLDVTPKLETDVINESVQNYDNYVITIEGLNLFTQGKSPEEIQHAIISVLQSMGKLEKYPYEKIRIRNLGNAPEMFE